MSLASCYHQPETHRLGPPTRDLPVLTPTLVVTVRRSWRRLESVEDQVSADVCHVDQVSNPDLAARGEAIDLLQLAKRIGPQCEAAEHKDLSGEKSLILDRVVDD